MFVYQREINPSCIQACGIFGRFVRSDSEDDPRDAFFADRAASAQRGMRARWIEMADFPRKMVVWTKNNNDFSHKKGGIDPYICELPIKLG